MFYYFSVRALSSGKDVICLYICFGYTIFQKGYLTFVHTGRIGVALTLPSILKYSPKFLHHIFAFCSNMATNYFQLKPVKCMSVEASGTRPSIIFSL